MLQMKLCGDLVLREKCEPVTEITPDISSLLDEMVKMMNDQNGVGLAAPQVGILQRFLIMKCKIGNDKEAKVYKMINPEIVEKSMEIVDMEEGCLSVLGSDDLPVYSNVSRPKYVVIKWTDEKGEQHSNKLSGYAARIVQHEIDHLDGILFIDYLSPVKREMVMSKVRRRK
ncbi:MAG: peptide deformylase [Alphaproteobacteria bacterium]|jgi:peptide deformylase|nr:peptide deformylase [Alphaproteobacteria bacterium]MBN2675505.1 peptide deformylase [Alphaproteobacteria bacterium]